MARFSFGRFNCKSQERLQPGSLPVRVTIRILEDAFNLGQGDFEYGDGIARVEIVQSRAQDALLSGKMRLCHPTDKHPLDALSTKRRQQLALGFSELETRLAGSHQN